MPASLQEVEAVVSEVGGIGVRQFIVAFPTDQSLLPAGSAITFSRNAWTGEHDPQKGQIIILSSIVRFVKGWRAQSARPVIFSNKEQADE